MANPAGWQDVTNPAGWETQACRRCSGRRFRSDDLDGGLHRQGQGRWRLGLPSEHLDTKRRHDGGVVHHLDLGDLVTDDTEREHGLDTPARGPNRPRLALDERHFGSFRLPCQCPRHG